MGPHMTEAGALLWEPARSPPPTLALPPALRSPEAQLCWELVIPLWSPPPKPACTPRFSGLEQGLTSLLPSSSRSPGPAQPLSLCSVLTRLLWI